MKTAYVSFLSGSSGLAKTCAHDTTCRPSRTAKPVPSRRARGLPVGLKTPTPTTPGLTACSVSATSAPAGAPASSITRTRLVRRGPLSQPPRRRSGAGSVTQIRYNPGGNKDFLSIGESKHERCGGCWAGLRGPPVGGGIRQEDGHDRLRPLG